MSKTEKNFPQGREAGRGGIGSGPAMLRPKERVKDFKGTAKRLLKFLLPYHMMIIIVMILAVLSTFFTILSPKIMGKATTKIFEGLMQKFNGGVYAGVDYPYIAQILMILVGLYVWSAIFGYIQQYLMVGVSQKVVYSMRREVNEKLNRLPLKFFDTRTHGEILSRVTNDIDTVSATLQQSMTQLITAVVTLIGIVIMMLTISPLLTFITAITIPISLVVTTKIAKRSQQYFASQQKSLGELNGHVEEMYTGHPVIKVFGHEQQSILKFSNINEKLYEAGWKAQFISGLIMPLLTFVNNIGYVAICVVGGIMVAKQSIEIGNIQAFIQYSRQFNHPIMQTANIANILQATIAAAERVFEILDEVEELPDSENAKTIHNPRGDVIFDQVSFGYQDSNIVIDEMNIDVRQGQTVAIVGPTGAGKTTLVNLLMRFYEIGKGTITIDGVNITDLKRHDLRSVFGMVLQDTWLFSGTIQENIAYGRKNATEEEVRRAAIAAHADHFVRTLPEGYHTVLNEEASNISQGQKQLLTIARAILANPAILILDEATSNVDSRTEAYIQKAMTELMKGKTSFVIAHRLSTIRDADIILVMNKGTVVEKGSHTELLAQKGFYYDLYNSQFALREEQIG